MQSSTWARFNPPPNWPHTEAFEPEIGWEPDPSLPPPPPGWPLWILGSEPPRTSRRAAIIAWGSIAVVVALMVFFLVGPRHTPTPAAGAAGSPCALLIPVRASTDKDALVVTMRIGGVCLGGTVLSQKTTVAITVSGQNVAAGVFDLSGTPIVVPQPARGGRAQYVLRDFRFPIGEFWRTPETLPALDPTATSSSPLDVRYDPVSQPPPDPTPKRDDALKALTAAAPAAPQFGDAESAALSGLNAIADSDRQPLEALREKWVPQLGARRPGDQAAGTTFTAQEILKEHLKSRLSRPNVRLLRASDWSTLNQPPDAWITVVGPGFVDPNAANGWCESTKLAPNDCFARLLSSAAPPPEPNEVRRG
ncbi:MAG: hypothetical protein QOH57_1837 [Mycobacterium sp.]|jgi:hypothetical protein|nr:hypothetical protein [Mycobacterium sp.]